MTSASPNDRARELLAPLYGEADALGLREASEFEAARDFLADALSEPVGDAAHSRMAEAMVREANARTRPVSVRPVGGTVWSQTGDGTPVPIMRCEGVGADASVLVPEGARAVLAYEDGTTVILAPSSRMTPRPVVSGEASGGSLARGRLYARVRHRAGGRFAIDTPAGRVAVMGTEFDLAIGGADRLSLLVAKGVVEYARHSRSESPRRVNRGEALSIDATRTESSRVGALEVRRRTAWAREGAGSGRRRAARAAVVFAAIAVAAGAAVWMHPGKAPAPVAEIRGTVGIDAVPGLSGAALPPAVGMLARAESRDWRATVRASEFRNGAWVPERETIALVRVGNAKADGSRDVECFARETVELDSQGMPIEETQLGFAQMATAPFQYHIAADGSVSSPTIVGVGKLNWVTGDMLVTMLEHEMLHLAMRLPATPGASVSSTCEGTFPQDPAARFKIVRELDVQRVENGRIFATATGTTRVDCMTQEGFPRKDVDTERIVDWRESRFRGTVEIDQATGMAVRSDFHVQRAQQDSLKLTPAGKKPVVNRLPVESGRTRVETIAEPLTDAR